MTLLRLYDGKHALIDLVEDSPFKALDTLKITFGWPSWAHRARRRRPRGVAADGAAGGA